VATLPPRHILEHTNHIASKRPEEILAMSIRNLATFCQLVLLILLPGARAAGPTLARKDTPLKPIVTGLKNPKSVAIGLDRRVYVGVIGEFAVSLQRGP
jgi:hypothetical protein